MERKVELTSSGWLFNPERLFWIAGQINKNRPLDAQVSVELYPVHYFMGWRLGSGRISLDKISQWEKEHGPVPVERIHLPFHWNLPQAFKNYFWNSLVPFAKPYEPGNFSDRKVAMAIAYKMGTVQNRFATELAGELGAGLNAHVHIIEEAGKRNQIDEVRGKSEYVWVENDVDRPRSRHQDIMRERDPQRALRAIRKYNLDGVILGIDHDFLYGIDPRETLSSDELSFKRHLRSIHLAGSNDRDLSADDDGNFWGFVDYVREKGFDDVSFCLDLNPFVMKKLSNREQLEYIKGLVEKLESR